MPSELLNAIKKARAGDHGSITDPKWRERLAERFGSRWKISKLRARMGGPLKVSADQEGSRPGRVKRAKRHGR